MKIVSINLGVGGTTGNIVQTLQDLLEKNGGKMMVFAPKVKGQATKSQISVICSNTIRRLNAYLGGLTGLEGCFSVIPTFRMLMRIDKFNPEIMHLHNIHNSYLNLPMLFSFIKKRGIKVIWTLHDCWTFTGHCPHFSFEKCYKWQTGCYDCPRYRQYPKSLFDNSKVMWKLKKLWFNGVENMTLVTPSRWLADHVSKSFIGSYPIKVINNGIDLSVFCAREGDFRDKHNIRDKIIVLGVAFGWSEKKGIDVFVDLAKRLDDKYRIVLVGTNETLDRSLPQNIISVHKTHNQYELAEIYTAADVFVNPTREENFPTTQMEALACGTPIIAFDTGGCKEIINEKCGCCVKMNDIDALEREIVNVCEKKKYIAEECLKRASLYDKDNKMGEYINLYESIT